METGNHILELTDFIRKIPQTEVWNYKDIVAVVTIDKAFNEQRIIDPFPLQLNALAMLVVLSGEVTMTVDYKPVNAKRGDVIVLIERHIINKMSPSKDFTAYHIIVENNYFKKSTRGEMPPSEGIVYNVRQNPVLSFNEQDFHWIIDNVKRLVYNLSRSDQKYQDSLVTNIIESFAYEIWNKAKQSDKPEEQNQYDEIALRFCDCVFQNFKEEHEVSFYAERLCLTPVLLSRAIKNATGKPALGIIHDIISTEAKIQLRRQEVSIQEIADYLHFSDQSSFSKFFKKNTGMSPMAFRKLD